jgi:hypothetical protein
MCGHAGEPISVRFIAQPLSGAAIQHITSKFLRTDIAIGADLLCAIGRRL